MVRVPKGIPDTKKLTSKQICGGATKRIYLYVKQNRPGNSYKLKEGWCVPLHVYIVNFGNYKGIPKLLLSCSKTLVQSLSWMNTTGSITLYKSEEEDEHEHNYGAK